MKARMETRWWRALQVVALLACGCHEPGEPAGTGAEEPTTLPALQASNEIAALYAAWGGAGGWLGAATSEERSTPDGRGRFVQYEHGAIYQTAETGTHVVFGALRDKWAELGWEQGSLGYPLSDSALTPDESGWYSHFEHGSIYWTKETGAHEVRGLIRERWASFGWETSALGYPVTDEFFNEGYSASNFQNGQIRWKQFGPELKVFTQNMAFLVEPAHAFDNVATGLQRPYLGLDCPSFADGACDSIDALIAFLKKERPDIVGLQEMFDQDAVDYLLRDREIAAQYPHRSFGPDESDLESDGGLVLLSRFPFVATDSIIYRKCSSEDCFANKGVLHASVAVADGVAYDVFVSHLQNPNAGGSGAARGTVAQQVMAMNAFVQAKRGTRQQPAIVMGDLNIDAFDPSQYGNLISQMGGPIDTWTATHPNELGITSDRNASFGSRSTGPKGVDGQRIDYILLYQGDRFQAALRDSRVIMEKTPTFFDMSDHYGLMSSFGQTQENDVIYTGNVSRVEVRLGTFLCLEVTDGTLDAYVPGEDPDEIQWSLGVTVDNRQSISGKSVLVEDIYEYTGGLPGNAPNLRDGPLNDHVAIRLEGQEVDDFFLGETGRASLGVATLHLWKEQLFEALHTDQAYGVGVLRGDGGEYTARVLVRAFR